MGGRINPGVAGKQVLTSGADLNNPHAAQDLDEKFSPMHDLAVTRKYQ